MKHRLLAFGVAACLQTGLGLAPGRAAEHLMAIQEVFPGTPSAPDVQYVMLRMTSRGQTFVANTFIEVQDPSGTIIGRFGTFAVNVGNAGALGCSYPNCPALIIGTAAAQTRLGFTLDQIVDGQAGRVPLPLEGGRACFRIGTGIVDCVAFEGFTGSNTISPLCSTCSCDTNLDTPAPELAPGFAMTRKQFNCVAKNNLLDFENRFPHPESNGGASANTDLDMDGLIEPLDCDDSDPGSLYPPRGVAMLDVAADAPTTISWTADATPAGSSLVYDLARFDPQAVRDAGGHCNEAALAGTFIASGVAGLSAQDAVDPPLGGIFFYAARSRSDCDAAPFC